MATWAGLVRKPPGDRSGAGALGTREAKRKLGCDALGVMEKHLEDRRFFVGDRYSVADIALHAYTHVADEAVSTWLAFPPSVLGWSASRLSLDTYL
jgi:glutathione S-transferase